MPEVLYTKENESALMRLFGRNAKLRLIDFFLDNPQNDYTRIEIMKALGMTKPTISKTLPILEEYEIVKITRKIGKAKLYQLNSGSYIVEKLSAISYILSL